MVENLTEFFKDLTLGLSPLFAALLAYRLGLKSYHHQREYELVRRRYLDEGIDSFGASVEHALIIFRNNWQHSQTVLNEFREKGTEIGEELFDKGYLDLDMSQFQMRPNYRVGELVGDQVFWKVQQYLFAFVHGATYFFKYDLGDLVSRDVSAENKSQVTKEEIIDTYSRECEKRFDESNRYYFLLEEVRNVTAEIENYRLTLKKVHALKRKKEIQASVKRLKDAFKDKLGRYSGAEENADGSNGS